MDRVWIILVGGLLPAFAFGISAIFQKLALGAGMGPGTYIVIDGVMQITLGLVLRAVLGETGFAPAGIGFGLAGAFLFALAAGAISFALQRWSAPVSLIAPITVISTLVTVVLGILILKEYSGAAALRVLAGAVLVVAGAALVATS